MIPALLSATAQICEQCTEMLVGMEVTIRVLSTEEVTASLTLTWYTSGKELLKHAASVNGKKYVTVMSTFPMATPVTSTSPTPVTGSIITMLESKSASLHTPVSPFHSFGAVPYPEPPALEVAANWNTKPPADTSRRNTPVSPIAIVPMTEGLTVCAHRSLREAASLGTKAAELSVAVSAVPRSNSGINRGKRPAGHTQPDLRPVDVVSISALDWHRSGSVYGSGFPVWPVRAIQNRQQDRLLFDIPNVASWVGALWGIVHNNNRRF